LPSSLLFRRLTMRQSLASPLLHQGEAQPNHLPFTDCPAPHRRQLTFPVTFLAKLLPHSCGGPPCRAVHNLGCWAGRLPSIQHIGIGLGAARSRSTTAGW
jgi:hypothetical protein